ncbi:sodium:solute symporter family protein [Botrimarina hoheduenensis]|uniref:Sodium/glucose cotransporter n=1 Tax=Botrimarina hoheduenensis TaxID=2528000 RepID=A0A5C5W9H6_9BACT|nr:sodium:solute symporter family protein [Botrimarina hoheduenensis]TWT47528.1 Sodium/glucose cotransporter [Botrimarina hoheduenensis]
MESLHYIDAAIVLAYIAATIGIGLAVSRRASKNLEAYFLGGNKIPWYLLGLSNASGMFDISGTMWLVYLLFVYGLKSAWIPWLWPVFNQIFMMVYLSVWLRRSGVMTGAEWIRFRFGEGRGAQMSHLVVVAFALINVVGFLAYGFVGIGKFAAEFVPPALALSADPTLNANLYGLIVTILTTLYVVKGGMMSVVFTEVLQFAIMLIACVWVGLIAMERVTTQTLAERTPAGWNELWFGWRLDLDWSSLLAAANTKIASDGWGLFGVFFTMMLFKGSLQSMAGPAPNYDMQRVLSTRTPREAALMSGLVSLVLLVPRYMLITGLTVLALAYFSDDLNAMGDAVDFERILPMALRDLIPVGLFGMLIAALLAAFMSTYAATVNAAPAYVVNDIYKRYINPNGDDRTYVRMSYAVSIAVVIIGTIFGFFVENLKDIVNWIVAALFGGYTAANLLKWHWWRFNGWGYFFGMAAGIVAALVFAVLFGTVYRDVPTLFGLEKNLAVFPIVLGSSLIGCFAGTLLTPPDSPKVLDEFYLRVRPWGFWGPVQRRVALQHPAATPNTDAARDLTNVAVGIAWQTALTLVGMYLVLKDYGNLTIALVTVVVCTVWLKFRWYDRLQDYPPGYRPTLLRTTPDEA